MGVTGHGLNLRFGFGEETTWGTPVARTKFLNVDSESMTSAQEIVVSGALDTAGVKTARVAVGNETYSGDVVFEAGYKDWEVLAKHAMGSVATVQTDAGAFTHTVTIADALPTGLTLEIYRDTADFAGVDASTAFLFEGTKITQIAYNAVLQSFLRVTCSFVAEDENRGAKTAAPTLSTADLAVFTQGAVTWDGGSLAVEEFTLTHANSLEGDKRRLGSALIKEPTRSGKIEVTGSFTADFDSFGMYDDMKAAQRREIVLTFTGSNVPNSSTAQKLAFTIRNIRITDWAAPTDDPGEYTQAVSFRAFRDETNNEYTLVFVNANTSVSA